MRAVRFDATARGFVAARTLGRLSQAFHFRSLTGLRYVVAPEPPPPPPGWALVRVLGCGVCGSDLSNLTYAGGTTLEPFSSFPAIPGHEILGRVERLGPRSAISAGAGYAAVRTSGEDRIAVGDRVAVDPMISCRTRGFAEGAFCPSCRDGLHSTCEMAGEEGELRIAGRPLGPGLVIGYHRDLPGGWGEWLLAHESQLFRMGAGISNRVAVLTEPLSIGVHAALNASPGKDDDVLVIGSGPIAFGAIWALRALGFEGTIVAQAKRPSEGKLARALGATDVVKPGAEARNALVATGARAYLPLLGEEVFAGGGFATVFDCVGSEASLDQALRHTRARGRIVMLGCAAELRRLDLTLLWARELEVKGFVGYGRERWRGEELHTFEVTRRLMVEGARDRAGAHPLEALVTHVFPLEEYRFALSAAWNRARTGAVKVVLTPDERAFGAE